MRVYKLIPPKVARQEDNRFCGHSFYPLTSKGRMTRMGDATEAKAQAQVFKLSKNSGMACGEYSFVDTENNTPPLGITSERTYYGHKSDSSAFSNRGDVEALAVDDCGR